MSSTFFIFFNLYIINLAKNPVSFVFANCQLNPVSMAIIALLPLHRLVLSLLSYNMFQVCDQQLRFLQLELDLLCFFQLYQMVLKYLLRIQLVNILYAVFG